ncbi:MAG: YqeG family HAD IIIA-type phosphatase [Bacilli bacterium]|jgi:hypothetical protein
MNKRFVPYCVAQSIYEIEPAFFQKHKVKTLFVDLDNTLDAYDTLSPSQRAKDLKRQLENLGIEIIVVSNNTKKRVSNYAIELGVKYIYSLGKPFAFKLKRFINRENIDLDKTMMIGDQIITDVCCGNGAGIRTILTHKIVEEDQWTTTFNRLFDNPRYRKMAKKQLLINWRNR